MRRNFDIAVFGGEMLCRRSSRLGPSRNQPRRFGDRLGPPPKRRAFWLRLRPWSLCREMLSGSA